MTTSQLRPGEAGSRDTSNCQAHPNARLLPFALSTATVLADGRVLTINDGQLRVSADDGETWDIHATLPGGTPAGGWNERLLLRCPSGTLVLVYLDMPNKDWAWDNDKKAPVRPPKLEVLSMRSTDGGLTWEPPVLVSDGYCGAIINAVITRSGRIVVPAQQLLTGFGPARHVQVMRVSDDEGLTWRCSTIIDLGGHGHHDGTLEGTVTELSDGRLWMLLRTNLDRFWQAWSDDQGLTWRTITPTAFDASSSPGCLLRLASGRHLLVWNRLYPVGLSEAEQAAWERAGGDCNTCQPVSSWHRRELSLCLSEDDCATWTEPVIIAKGRQVDYPTVIEREPGRIWIFTRFGQRIGVEFHEEAFI